MRYIERILQPGEKLVHQTTVHWIVYLPGIALLIVALVVLSRVGGSTMPGFWWGLGMLCGALAVGWLFYAWLKRWTTEIDVTDRRVVYKRGLIVRHTVEVNMDKIESVDVDQGILGRILNYGDVTIRGTGTTLEPLHHLEAPLEFRNHVTAR